jgi:hypothetical protein
MDRKQVYFETCAIIVGLVSRGKHMHGVALNLNMSYTYDSDDAFISYANHVKNVVSQNA